MKLIKMLKYYHVKGDFEALRNGYEYYLRIGMNDSLEDFKKGTPIYYVKISKYNPEVQFSKLIITSKLFR